jgi:two-component system, cell cycle sensor histidine kinase and response regulator CckA
MQDIAETQRPMVIQNQFAQLQLLFDLAGAVGRAQDAGEVCRAAVEGLVRALAADRAGVLIFDDDGVARFKASVGLSGEYRAAVEGHSPWKQGSRDAQAIAIPDVLCEPSVSMFRDVFVKEGIRAIAFIPMLGKSGLIGKFVLYHNQPHEFHPEELQVAQTIATHVGFAAERQQSEEALRASQRILAIAQSAARLGAWDWDLRTNRTKISGEYARLHGLPPSHPEVTHAEWLDMVHPDDRERMEAAARESIERTHSWDVEFRVVWPDRSVHWLLAKGKVYLDSAGRPVRMAGVSLDITERKQTEAALLESEERFRNMADTAPVMIWVAGPDKVLTFFNKTWLDYVGRTLNQELNNGWIENVHPDDLDRCFASYASSFDAHENFHIEYRMRRADGEYRWVLCSGVPRFAPGGVFAGYIGSDIDITDLRRAHAEDFERQKRESLGALSAGIAHDFNNLLGSILVDAELAEADLPAASPPFEQIQRIKAVAIRASEIVRELMIYSGQDKADLGPVDLSRLVEDMLELLKVSVSKHAVLETDLPTHLPAVRGNAAQLRQVAMNLIINASEAIGDRHGVIRVATSLAPGGDALRLQVSDTGCGMTSEQKARIFEPFFTTKFAGRGLGMAVVQGIVRDHGGSIHLASAPGEGTTFQILLPCDDRPADPPAAAHSSAAGPASNGRGTVLLVEDEEMLRISLSKLLGKRGFSVIEAADGCAAIDFFWRHRDRIDVILLDVTIAGCSSREVLAEARRIRPDIKVILTSAYSREMVIPSLGPQPVDAFIRKPFPLADLVELLRTTLA